MALQPKTFKHGRWFCEKNKIKDNKKKMLTLATNLLSQLF